MYRWDQESLTDETQDKTARNNPTIPFDLAGQSRHETPSANEESEI